MDLLNKKWAVLILVLFIFFMFYKAIVCAIILGLLLLIIGFKTWLFLSNISNNGIKTFGTIQSFGPKDSEGNRLPIIEYFTNNDECITETPKFYAYSSVTRIRNPEKHVGKRTRIVYDPNNVKHFILHGESGFYTFTSVFMMLVGLIFITMASLTLGGFIN